MIQQVIHEKMHSLFVAKPIDHKYMMQWFGEFDALPEVKYTDLKGRNHQFPYMNNVPLNAKEDACR